jgi:hypothetical protein
MSWRRALVAVFAAAVCTVPGHAFANTIHYVLTAESRLTRLCQGCDPGGASSESLNGSFDVTEVASDYAVEAITGFFVQSASHAVKGAGFLQRLGSDRMAMVIDGTIDGSSILLTSGRKQLSRRNEIRMQLTSPKGETTGIRLTIVAVPVVANGDDADGDRISDDLDNCTQLANPDQSDADGDATGDACDQCADTASSDVVVADGCSLAQKCPCSGPSPDGEWENQRAYVQCVAKQLKTLRQSEHLGKSEVRRMLQDAVKSGCGRRVIALL